MVSSSKSWLCERPSPVAYQPVVLYKHGICPSHRDRELQTDPARCSGQRRYLSREQSFTPPTQALLFEHWCLKHTVQAHGEEKAILIDFINQFTNLLLTTGGAVNFNNARSMHLLIFRIQWNRSPAAAKKKLRAWLKWICMILSHQEFTVTHSLSQTVLHQWGTNMRIHTTCLKGYSLL